MLFTEKKKKKKINIKDVEMEQKEECCNKYSYKIYAQLPIFLMNV